MSEQHEVNKDEKQAEENAATQQVNDAPPAADEFNLTIKKLEMPVRPRGVLADG
jgi:hypothetical protein